MSLNLNNDWLRRELGTTASTGDQIITRYYGYSNTINGADTDDIWSIRKVTLSTGVESVSWSDNQVLSYKAKWSERAANFIAPSSSLGLTYSISGGSSTFTWNSLAGVNKYNIIVRNNTGSIVNKNGTSTNNSNQTVTETYFNATNHTQYFQSGSYSVVLQAINAGGALTATYSFQVA